MINQMILNDSTLGVPQDKKYDLTGTGLEHDCAYVYSVQAKGGTLLFKYKYRDNNTMSNVDYSIISLTHVSILGEFPPKNKSDLFFFQRSIWAKDFELHVLDGLGLEYKIED